MPQIQHSLKIKSEYSHFFNLFQFCFEIYKYNKFHIKKNYQIINLSYINFTIIEVIFTYIIDFCRIGSFNNSIIDTCFIFCK